MICEIINIFNFSPELVEQIELREAKNGEPLFVITLKTGINGVNITIKKILTSGLNIYLVNEMLRSLNTGIDIKFENFHQYYDLLKQVCGKLKILYLFLGKEVL